MKIRRNQGELNELDEDDNKKEGFVKDLEQA